MGAGTDTEHPTRSTGTAPTAVDRRLPWIVGLIGVVASLVAARWSYPGLGNDATSYVAIADHIAEGRGLGYFLEPQLGLWPPGFPGVLAFFRWAFDIDPQHTALAINALTPIPIALLSHAVLRRLVRDQRLVAIGVIVATLGPATLSQTYFVQTEPTFIVVVLATLWAIYRFVDTHSWWWLALAVVLQWIGYMDRYVALVMIGSAALWLVFDTSWPRLRERLRNGIVFFVGANVVPLAWVVRNAVVVGEPFGVRDTPVATYRRNAIDAITSVGQYIHGFSVYEPATGLLRLFSLALLVAVAVGAALLVVRARRDVASRTGRPPGLPAMIGHPVGLPLIYAGAHFAYMIYSASTIAFDPVNTRYLVPMFIPTLLVALTLIDRGAPVPGTGGSGSDTLTRTVAAGLVVFLAAQVVVGAVRVSASYWDDRAQRYNSARAVEVQESPVFDEVPDDCRLLSNFPEFTYLAGGFEALRSPRITKFASSDRLTELEDLREAVDDGESWCLIWIDEDASEVFFAQTYQYQLDVLGEEFDLDEVASDDDVAVYRVLPAE